MNYAIIKQAFTLLCNYTTFLHYVQIFDAPG